MTAPGDTHRMAVTAMALQTLSLPREGRGTAVEPASEIGSAAVTPHPEVSSYR